MVPCFCWLLFKSILKGVHLFEKSDLGSPIHDKFSVRYWASLVLVKLRELSLLR